MLAARMPLLGILLAVAVLCGETVGLRAYIGGEQARADQAALRSAQRASEQATQDAARTKVALEILIARLDKLDAEINELLRGICRLREPQDSAELTKLRLRIMELKRERLRLGRRSLDVDDPLGVPDSGPRRGFDRQPAPS